MPIADVCRKHECESARGLGASHLLTIEALRLQEAFGAEVKIYDPHGLPLPDDVRADHPKV